MSIELILLTVLVLLVFAVIYLAHKSGQESADLEQAQANQEQMRKYEKIDSKPSIDDPFNRMRDN